MPKTLRSLILPGMFAVLYAGCSTDSVPQHGSAPRRESPPKQVGKKLTDKQIQRRNELLKPIASQLKEIRRNGGWIRVAASLEGQPVGKVQELIDLANLESFDPMTGTTTYRFAPVPVLANIEDPEGGDLQIVVRAGTVEQATSSILPES